VLLTAIAFSFVHSPFFDLFNEDKEIFHYAGMAIAKGQVPYRDFFDHKPPFIFFLNYWGYITGPWGFWLLDTAMLTVAVVAFYRLCSKKQLPYPWLLPCLFAVLLRSHLVSNGTGMTREYTTIAMVLFFCLMQGTRRLRFFWMGVVAGLSFFMQQDATLILFPFALYGMLEQVGNFRTFIVRGLQMLGGFACIAIPVVSYFALNHALGDFWKYAFATNFNVYVEKKPLASHLEFMTGHLHATGFYLLFYSSVFFALLLFYFNSRKGLLTAVLAATALCFLNQYLSGRHITYYLLPLSGALPLLLFVLLTYSPAIPAIIKRAGSIVYVLTLILIQLLTQYKTYFATEKTHVWIADTQEYLYLKDKHLQDYQVFVFCSSRFLYVNNQLHVLAPTKWIYHHFWYWFKNWDPDNSKLHEIEQDLLRHQTIYVLDFSEHFMFKATNHYDDWKAFLNTYYVPLMPYSEKSKCILWQLKTAAASPQASQ
jgi:hypothetical protein